MSNLDDAIRIARAQDERRSVARIAFERRENKGSIHLTEMELSSYIALGFEAGADWADKQAHK